ncbi:MAG: hypothetical protein H6Q73_3292 [Firmicutes bacterium]|nr:hypothetical protein [Bacillota bacterium]
MNRRSRKRYRFDFDAFIRALILAGFICLFIWLIKTQQLSLYVNPQFSSLTQITCYLLFPMFISQAATIFRPIYTFKAHHGYNHNLIWIYAPFIFVLGLSFAVPSNTLNANLVNAKGLNSQLSAPVVTQYEYPRPLAAKLHNLQSIEVTDPDYTEIMSELALYPNDYINKELIMTGFVFNPPGITNNQFSLVRYVIVCCPSDALPYGVLCEDKSANKYKDGTWLSIKGIIKQTHFDGGVVPLIKISSSQPVKEPKNPYVFSPH